MPHRKTHKSPLLLQLKIVVMCGLAAMTFGLSERVMAEKSQPQNISTQAKDLQLNNNGTESIFTPPVELSQNDNSSINNFVNNSQNNKSRVNNFVSQKSTPVNSQNNKSRVNNFVGQKSTPINPNIPAKPIQIAQVSFPDIQNHWAKTFIEALAAKDIISGYPDGFYRPDQKVTRAEFAAIIRKAFSDKNTVREAIAFVDVPQRYWGFDAIKRADEIGFLTGYPDRTFRPDTNIPRVEVLVSLISGLGLNTSKEVGLASFYDDSGDIPNYAVNQLAAATENQIVVNYDNVKTLNPNQTATRADVAAFVYQALVNNGTLPKIAADNPVAAYIVGYQAPVAEKPPEPKPNEDDLKEYILPEPPTTYVVTGGGVGDKGVPGSSITSPSGFGSQWGDVFASASYQERTRYGTEDDGSVSVGFGLGDARKYAGLEVSLASVSTFRRGFYENGALSLKLHRLLTHDISIAAGIENLATWGDTDGGTSGYGVITKYFQLQDSPDKPFSSLVANIGVGGGRFRSESDVINRKDTVNVFGSLGVRVFRPISFIADWSGQDLGLGVSIAPFRNIPLTINPSVVDVTNNAGDGARFTIGVGYGLKF